MGSNNNSIQLLFYRLQILSLALTCTGLFYKLINMGMDINIVQLIKNMYDKTSQSLKFNEYRSEIFSTHRGVRQGCILSPKLFNLFINDIPTMFNDECKPVTLGSEKLNCLLYADDLIMISETKPGIQKCLDKLHHYTKMWNLEVNLKKTKIMIFQRNGRKCKDMFLLGKNIIKHAKEYKYLGTIVTNSGNFKTNEIYKKKKGLRASYLVTQSLGPKAKTSTYLNIFHKTIEPILTYNAEVTMAYFPLTWDCNKFKEKMWEHGEEINKVFMSFIRQILGVNKKTSNLALLTETGKYPLIFKIYLSIFKYWVRLNETPSKLLAEALKTNQINDKPGNLSWTRIITYLTHITSISNDKDINEFKNKLKTSFDVWWNSQVTLNNQKKLKFYFEHKKTFSFEKYLDNIPKDIRINLTKLRLSSHCLPIEILRYKDIERKDRLCSICTQDIMGDENHYLLQCTNSQITLVRNQFLSKIDRINPQFKHFTNKDIMRYCINMKDIKIQQTTAMFVKKLYETYKSEFRTPPLNVLCHRKLKHNSGPI